MNYSGCIGDIRLEERGNKIAECMIEKGTAILNRLASDRASLVASCRFFGNEFVTAEDIVRESSNRCRDAVEGLHVLAISDSSEINYRKRSGKLSKEDENLGPVGNNTDIGFFIHPTFVVDAKDGFPLGLSHVRVWNRQWDRETKQDRCLPSLPIEEKESYKWIDNCRKSKKVLSKAACVTYIADRESDIYEEFVLVPDEKTHLLIRSMHDRRLHDKDQTLYGYISSLDKAGTYELEIKKSQKKREPRIASMEVRYGKVRIAKPSNLGDYPEYVEMYAVEAREHARTVPEGEEPVLWRLLTTHSVKTLLDAIQIIFWYSIRWQVEQLFRTIKKQGLDVEGSHIENGSALKKLVLMALSAAVRIMQLVTGRDGSTHRPGTIVFSPKELEFLKVLLGVYEGKTIKQKNPFHEYSLAWGAWIIARIGGWKGYQRACPAGPITMKRGLEKFSSLFEGWLLHQMSPPGAVPELDPEDVCIE